MDAVAPGGRVGAGVDVVGLDEICGCGARGDCTGGEVACHVDGCEAGCGGREVRGHEICFRAGGDIDGGCGGELEGGGAGAGGCVGDGHDEGGVGVG